MIKTERGLEFPAATGENQLRREEIFCEMYPTVKNWIDRYPSPATKKNYSIALLWFCLKVDMTPREFGDLSKTQEDMIKARNIATEYLQTVKSPGQASLATNALKSFYRYYTSGFPLPLDTKKGGAAHISLSKKRKTQRRKYAWGTNEEIRQKVRKIVSHARDLRDEAMITFLYQSGVRDNVLLSLRNKDVQEYVNVNALRLRKKEERVLVLTITSDLDSKVANYDFPLLREKQVYGYYTYLARDGLKLFQRYLDEYQPREYVWFPRKENPTSIRAFQIRFKTCVKKAGFPPDQIWPHQLRSLFEQLGGEALKDTQIEFLAGHILPGAQRSYKWQNIQDCARFYLQIQF